MNATEKIARFIANTAYEDIPRPVLDATRTIILDGIANVLGGSRQPVLEHVRRYVERLGGRPDCTVVGGSFRTNPPLAAFANGAAMHVLDYEPQGIPSTHGTSTLLPGILALAEVNGASRQFRQDGRGSGAAGRRRVHRQRFDLRNAARLRGDHLRQRVRVGRPRWTDWASGGTSSNTGSISSAIRPRSACSGRRSPWCCCAKKNAIRADDVEWLELEVSSQRAGVSPLRLRQDSPASSVSSIAPPSL